NRVQIVAHILFVERLEGLRIGPSVPVPRRVGREGFINQHQTAVPPAELKLRVREDQPTQRRVGGRKRVQPDAELSQLTCGAGTAAGSSPGARRAMSTGSNVMRWLVTMWAVRANQNAERAVRTRPLSGTGVGSTWSNAEIRSVATISRFRPAS